MLDDESELIPADRADVTPRFVRGGATYGGLAIVQRGSALLVLPLLLQAVTPADYGQIALLTSIAGAASIVLSFGLEAAIVRAYFQLAGDPNEQRSYLETLGAFLFFVPFAAWLIAAVLLLGSTGGSTASVYLIVALAAAVVQVPVNTLLLVVLRLEERLRDYSAICLVSAVAYVGLTLLLVAVLGLGVPGWLVATLGSYTLMLAIACWVLRDRFALHLSRRHLVASLVFGIPLLPHLLAHWGLSLSDRLILGVWVSEADLGVYNLGYQLALPIGLLAGAINKAVTPHLSRAAAEGGGTDGMSRMVTLQVWTTAFLGLGVILLAPVVIDLLLPATYVPAAAVATWVAIGYVFYGWYVVPMNGLSVIQGRTRWIWIATVVAACVNIGLNLLLVPRFGIMAAAVTTAIGYGTLLAAVGLMAMRSHAMTVPLEWRRMAAGTFAMVVLGVVTVVTTNPADPLGAAVRVAVTLSVLLLVVAIEGGAMPIVLRRVRA